MTFIPIRGIFQLTRMAAVVVAVAAVPVLLKKNKRLAEQIGETLVKAGEKLKGDGTNSEASAPPKAEEAAAEAPPQEAPPKATAAKATATKSAATKSTATKSGAKKATVKAGAKPAAKKTTVKAKKGSSTGPKS